MRKLIFTLLVSLFAGTFVSAQQPSFGKGDNVASVGIGLLRTSYYGIGGWYGSSVKRTQTPLIFVSYERCVWDNIFNEKSSLGVGGLFGYAFTNYKEAEWKYHDFTVGLRGAFHYALVDKLDTYGTLGFGLAFSTFPKGYEYNPKSNARAFPIFSAGARYYFTDALAAFAEVGFSYTVFNMGLAFKF